MSDREIERVLAGQQPATRSDLAEVARFVAHLRATAAAERVPPMRPDLVAQLDAADRQQRAVFRASRRRAVEIEREHARREVARSHLRWRLVGAAAIVVMLGGVVVAGLQTAPAPSPTETDGDLAPADRLVEPPEATIPPATKPPRSTEPPPPPPEPEPQVEVPQAPLDTEARNGDPDSFGTESLDWPWDWPEECVEGDFVCWWEEFGDRGRPDRPGGR